MYIFLDSHIILTYSCAQCQPYVDQGDNVAMYHGIVNYYEVVIYVNEGDNVAWYHGIMNYYEVINLVVMLLHVLIF
jgi:hypothetical protein